MVEHHSSELERLDVVLIQNEGFLEALHRRLEVAQLSEGQAGGEQEGVVLHSLPWSRQDLMYL